MLREITRRKSHTIFKRPANPSNQNTYERAKVPEKPPKTGPEITAKDADAEINNQPDRSKGLRENASNQLATQRDSLVQRSPELAETSKDHGSEATDQNQRENLEWFSTWDED